MPESCRGPSWLDISTRLAKNESTEPLGLWLIGRHPKVGPFRIQRVKSGGLSLSLDLYILADTGALEIKREYPFDFTIRIWHDLRTHETYKNSIVGG